MYFPTCFDDRTERGTRGNSYCEKIHVKALLHLYKLIQRTKSKSRNNLRGEWAFKRICNEILTNQKWKVKANAHTWRPECIDIHAPSITDASAFRIYYELNNICKRRFQNKNQLNLKRKWRDPLHFFFNMYKNTSDK